jgi:hypothetical protein
LGSSDSDTEAWDYVPKQEHPEECEEKSPQTEQSTVAAFQTVSESPPDAPLIVYTFEVVIRIGPHSPDTLHNFFLKPQNPNRTPPNLRPKSNRCQESRDLASHLTNNHAHTNLSKILAQRERDECRKLYHRDQKGKEVVLVGYFCSHTDYEAKLAKLSKGRPQNWVGLGVIFLETQHRMPSPIGEIIFLTCYNGRLITAATKERDPIDCLDWYEVKGNEMGQRSYRDVGRPKAVAKKSSILAKSLYMYIPGSLLTNRGAFLRSNVLPAVAAYVGLVGLTSELGFYPRSQRKSLYSQSMMLLHRDSTSSTRILTKSRWQVAIARPSLTS